VKTIEYLFLHNSKHLLLSKTSQNPNDLIPKKRLVKINIFIEKGAKANIPTKPAINE
jgi:hypothetical protein